MLLRVGQRLAMCRRGFHLALASHTLLHTNSPPAPALLQGYHPPAPALLQGCYPPAPALLQGYHPPAPALLQSRSRHWSSSDIREEEEVQERRKTPAPEKKFRYSKAVDAEFMETMRERPRLSKSVSPELEEQIVGDKAGTKFLLKQVLGELTDLEVRKFPFPMPPSLSLEEWRVLLSLLDYRSRFAYLDLLAQEQCELTKDVGMTLEQIKARDEVMSAPLQISEETLEAAMEQDEDRRRTFKLFLMTHEMLRQDGSWVPWKLSTPEVRDISKLGGGRHQFMRYIRFLEIKESERRNDLIKKRMSRARRVVAVEQVKKDKEEVEHIYYGLGANVIHLRMNKARVLQQENWNAIRAFQYSTPLIIDFSYFKEMKSQKHIKSMIFKEIQNAYSWNREARTPYALHFTNVTPELEQWLEQSLMIDVRAPDIPVHITKENHLDMFDTEKLVYLSPDSRNDLKEVSDDDIYVIGALINKTEEDRGPLTLAKAKRLNIRHARFPLKRTLGLTCELNVDACVGIMCDMKGYNDWGYACRWVPARHMAARAQTGSMEQQMRYHAHRNLSPTSGISADMVERNRRLNPIQYRDMFKRISKTASFDEINQIMTTHKF